MEDRRSPGIFLMPRPLGLRTSLNRYSLSAGNFDGPDLDRRKQAARCLRGGHRLPPRMGGVLRFIAARRPRRKIGFECGQSEIFPFPGVVQERAALTGAEGRGLTVQGSYRAISAHAFQNGIPARMHERSPPVVPLARDDLGRQRFSISLARPAESPNGFRTLDGPAASSVMAFDPAKVSAFALFGRGRSH